MAESETERGVQSNGSNREHPDRGGGRSSNLGGPLLNFHLHSSLGGASRHLARTRSEVHFWLAI